MLLLSLPFLLSSLLLKAKEKRPFEFIFYHTNKMLRSVLIGSWLPASSATLQIQVFLHIKLTIVETLLQTITKIFVYACDANKFNNITNMTREKYR